MSGQPSAQIDSSSKIYSRFSRNFRPRDLISLPLQTVVARGATATMAGRRPALGRISSEGGRMSSASSKPLPAILNRKRKNDQEDPSQPVRNSFESDCDKFQFQIIHFFLSVQSIWILISPDFFSGLAQLLLNEQQGRDGREHAGRLIFKHFQAPTHLQVKSRPIDIDFNLNEVFIYFVPQSSSTVNPVDKLRQCSSGDVHGVHHQLLQQRWCLCLEAAWFEQQ